MKLGDKVTPKTPCGLILADCPINGEYKQHRKDICVFRGIGVIVDQSECVIDYDIWDELSGNEPDALYKAGQVPYVNYLIRCDAGIGWAGAGALVAA